MTIGELNELKSYLRIDGDNDDGLLSMLSDAGEAYLTNAGIPVSDLPLYRLARALYVGIHYDRRDGASGNNDGFSRAMQSIILQLKNGM